MIMVPIFYFATKKIILWKKGYLKGHSAFLSSVRSIRQSSHLGYKLNHKVPSYYKLILLNQMVFQSLQTAYTM